MRDYNRSYYNKLQQYLQNSKYALLSKGRLINSDYNLTFSPKHSKIYGRSYFIKIFNKKSASLEIRLYRL